MLPHKAAVTPSLWAPVLTKCCNRNKCLKPLLSFRRTLSNWVYEFDKWAPSVVKVSYKVSNDILSYKVKIS